MIEETGGLSLALVHTVGEVGFADGGRTSAGVGRLRRPRRIRRYVDSVSPAWWEGEFLAKPESAFDDDQVRILHRHRGNRKRRRARVGLDVGYGADLYDGLEEELADERVERRPTVTLPPHMI